MAKNEINTKENKVFLQIELSKNISLSLRVHKILDSNYKKILITDELHTQNFLKSGLRVSLINPENSNLESMKIGEIRSILKDKNRIVIETFNEI
jgi:hypothetical protein